MDLFDNKTIGPMLIAQEAEAFDDANYIFELKLDGERCLAYLSTNGVEFLNKRHRKMNAHVPELAQVYRQAQATCILDGELMILKDGVPNFAEIQRRSLMANPFKIELAAKKYPATFTAYDILYYDGEQVTDRPLLERKDLLRQSFSEDERLARSRFIEERGIAFYELAKAQDLEGIVAKRKDSIYRIGTRSKDWLKIKNMKDEDFVVCGYIVKAEEEKYVASLILGAYQDERLISQGHVTLGLSRQEFAVITQCPRMAFSPFGPIDEGAVYLEPTLVCSVKYMERTQYGGLRQPVFKGLRFDKEAKDCILGRYTDSSIT